MKNVLLVNRKTTNCGVHQYGLNIFESLEKSNKNKYFYLETNDSETLINFLNNNKIDVIIFNYIIWVMGWITNDLISSLFLNYKIYFIYHDGDIPNFPYNGILYNDPTKNVNNINEFLIDRCLFEFESNEKINLDKTIISSFGFGFPDKGFQKIINRINEEFSGAIIRLHMPNANVDPFNNLKNQTLDLCNKEVKSKNEIIITNNYMSNLELLNWLSESTINCFFYDNKSSKGISSVIDYALSVNVPIAVTDCDMMRHIISDKISIEKNKISDIINYGCTHLEEYKKNWSNKNFRDKLDYIIN
jgi:hypothetical protein